VAKAGRQLWRLSSPSPCSSWATWSPLSRAMSRWLLNISQDGDSTNSLGNLCQYPIALMLIKKKSFPIFKCDFLHFSFHLLPLLLSLGTPGKSLPPNSFKNWDTYSELCYLLLKIQVKHGHTSVGPSEVQRLHSSCAPSGASPYCSKYGADKDRPPLPKRSGRPRSLGSHAADTWKVMCTARKCFKYRHCFPHV